MHTFLAEQFIPASVDEVWNFISSPANLKHITPSHMGFEITSGNEGENMYAGMIISYRVKPLLSIPMTWVTEITHVKEKAFFVDEQRIGPYSFWHHQHHIAAVNGGVLMRDIVNYVIPGGVIGKAMNSLLVKKKLEDIFAYRKKAVDKRFPNSKKG